MKRYRAVAEELRKSANPVVRLKILRDVFGELDTKAIAKLRDEIRRSEDARALLSDCNERNDLAPYQKWNGAHWVLVTLAELHYPQGDPRIAPLFDRVHDWIDSNETAPEAPEHGRYRVHASMHGNVVWSAVTLGLDDQRVAGVVAQILKYQWPDGGWNCDRRREARHSSFTHSSIALRGLVAYAKNRKVAALSAAIDRAAELFLERHLFKRKTNGKIIEADFTLLNYPYYHQYNVLFGLKIMCEAGRIGDGRCSDALDLLESKLIDREGFALEKKYYHHTQSNPHRYTPVRWEQAKLGRANQYVTADALAVLKQAGRFV